MTRDEDEFDGIDISGPWGGVRIGSGGMRAGGWGDDDPEVRSVRRRVRRRLNFIRNLSIYVVVVGSLALLDWATGGDFWVQWVAIIWGAFIAVELVSFITPAIWGRDAEDRMVQREIEKRRGSATVSRTPPDGEA